MASTTKYVRLTIDKEAGSSPASSSSSLSSPSISAPASCTRISPRFPCAVIVVAILTLAIFGFRCLTYVTPSPCTYDYSTLPVGAGNSNDTSGPPPTPKLTRRLPDAIIFGVRKCGTRALLNFLNRHPSVRAAGKEIHYFDNNYYLGDDWYREQMPLAADDQIVVEKTPGYFIEPNAPMRVMNTLGTNVKLILIVRDPVERTVSDYVQLKLKYERTKNRRRDADLDARPSLPMASFEEKVLSSDGRINTSYKPVRIGQYDVHLKRWMDVFPARQILVVDGENFVKNPFQSLVEVESFLGIEHRLSQDLFVLNQETGFYCLKTDDHKTLETPGISEQGCLAKSKGRPHPTISSQVRKRLTAFYRKHVSKFFQKIGKKFEDWPTYQESG